MKKTLKLKMIILTLILMVVTLFSYQKIYADSGINITNVDISNFPEITVYFDVKGVNVNHLSKDGFTIYDLNGNSISPKKFSINNKSGKKVSSLMIDTSGSMFGSSLETAKKLSKNFIDDVLSNKKNRLDLYEFNTTPRRRGTFFDSKTVLKSVINQLEADGGTAIYDTIIEGIYAIIGQSGSKSIIVVTDGQDEHSYHSFYDAKQLALKNKIPVYIVQIGEKDESLQNLAIETGGKFYTDKVSNLRKRLNKIFSLGTEQSSITFIAKNKYPNSNDYLNLVYSKNGKDLSGDVNFSSDINDVPLQNRIVKVTSSGNKAPENIKKENKTYFYHPIYAFDNTAESAWVGDKSKNWIKAEFSKTEKINSLYIRNGYWYMPSGKNRLAQNSRPKTIRITTDKGYSKKFTLNDPANKIASLLDSNGQAINDGQELKLGIKAKWIKIEILNTYKGTLWPNDICISDIIFK